MQTIIAAVVIACLSTISQAVTGFGFALVLVPLLSLIVEPRMAVMVSLSAGLIVKTPLLIQSWRHVETRKIAPLCATSLVGAYGGTRVLVSVDANVLKIVIGIVVVALAIPLLLEISRPIRREWLATPVIGLVSGVLTGATSMGGPPVVLLGVNQSWGKDSFRANLLAFFTVSNAASLILLIAAGAVPPEVWQLDLYLVPGVAVGIVVGNALFHRIPAGPFRKLIVTVVIVSGLLSAWTGATT